MLLGEDNRTISWQAGWRKKRHADMTPEELEKVRSEAREGSHRRYHDPERIDHFREMNRLWYRNLSPDKKAVIAQKKSEYNKARQKSMSTEQKQAHNAYVRSWKSASEDRQDAYRKKNREWYAKRDVEQKRRKNEVEKSRLAARDTKRKAHDRAVNTAWKHANRNIHNESNKKRKEAAKAGGNFTAQEWADLVSSCGYQCLCCGKKEPDVSMTVDHIVPLSKGGSNTIDNLQPLCGTCNSKKGTSTIRYEVPDAA